MNIRIATITKAALLLLVFGCFSLPAWSQTCALCYTQAAGAGPRMIQALKSGILVLIFPPMGICIGLMVMSYKKRNQFGQQSNSERKADRRSDLGW
ncbi:MAG: hypothetical protein ABR861_12495 [Terriglobales bacterium]|jgi:hypothetical protein